LRALTCTVELRTFLTGSDWSLGLPEQHTNRTARLEARIAPEALAVVRRAAEIQGRSVSDFVVAAAQEAAQKTVSGFTLLPGACSSRSIPHSGVSPHSEIFPFNMLWQVQTIRRTRSAQRSRLRP
jgi:uncharacterized protein DUF1778